MISDPLGRLLDRGKRWAGRRRRTSDNGPVCRVTLDLRRLTPTDGYDSVEALLRAAPGVVDVRLQPGRHRAVVLHDSRTSLPQLWNWLLQQRADPPGTPDPG